MDELQNNNPEQRDEIEILEKNVEEKSNKDDAEKQKNDVPKYASGKIANVKWHKMLYLRMTI